MRSLEAHTAPSAGGYHQLWRSAPPEQYLTLEVATCGTATLVLTESVELIQESGYKIFLDLEPQGEGPVGSTDECGGYRKMLVSWVDGFVTTATYDDNGEIGSRLNHTTVRFTVNFIAFTSDGLDTADWRFQGFQGIRGVQLLDD